MTLLDELQNILHLRFAGENDPICATCKFYRIWETGCRSSNCLVLGRTMGMGDAIETDRRCCDGWSQCPEQWEIYSKGVNANPFWADPYISRNEQYQHRFGVLRREIRRLRRKCGEDE